MNKRRIGEKTYRSNYQRFTEKELWQLEECLCNYFQDEGLTTDNGKPICPFCGNSTRTKIQESVSKPYTFACFKCDIVLGLIELHKRRYGLGFYQAATELASRYLHGFTEEAPRPRTKQTAPPQVEKEIVEDEKGFTPFDCLHLVNASKLRLAEIFQNEEKYRGLTQEMLQKYDIGYMPDWTYPRKYIAGVLSQKHPSKRFIVPLTLDNKVVGYESRLVGKPVTITTKKGEEVKELKAIPVYSKKATNHTFPLFNEKALDEEYCVIVEGWLDAIMLTESGIPTCATCGNTKLAGLMHRISTAKAKHIFILFDNDELAYTDAGVLIDKGQAYAVKAKKKLQACLSPYRTSSDEEIDALTSELAKAGGYANFPKDKYKRLLELSNKPKEPTEKQVFLVPTIGFTLGEKDFNDMHKNRGVEGHLIYVGWMNYIVRVSNFIRGFVTAYKQGEGVLKEQLEHAFFVGWLGKWSTNEDGSVNQNLDTKCDDCVAKIDQLFRIIQNRTTDERRYHKRELAPDGETHVILGRIRRETLNHSERIKAKEVRLSYADPDRAFLDVSEKYLDKGK